MIALIASFFSLCVGPLIYQTFGPLKRTDKIVSGIVLVIVTGVICIEVIPATYQTIGFFALLLALIGFAGPTFIESSFEKAAETTHKLTIYLGITGLLVHAFIDGAAIQGDENSVNNGLTLAIILHRVPVGLTIWWMLKPLLGERYALTTLVMMGLSTFAGYGLNHAIGDYQNNYIFAVIQAFIAGSLLHVVIHKPHSDGCMHTNEAHQQHAHQTHDHEHHAHNHNHDHNHDHNHELDHNHEEHHEHQQSPKSQVVRNFIFRWETLGYALGIVILLFILYQHH